MYAIWSDEWKVTKQPSKNNKYTVEAAQFGKNIGMNYQWLKKVSLENLSVTESHDDAGNCFTKSNGIYTAASSVEATKTSTFAFNMDKIGQIPLDYQLKSLGIFSKMNIYIDGQQVLRQSDSSSSLQTFESPIIDKGSHVMKVEAYFSRLDVGVTSSMQLKPSKYL